MARITVEYPTSAVTRAVSFPDDLALSQMLLVWQNRQRNAATPAVEQPTPDKLAVLFLQMVTGYIGDVAEAEQRMQSEEAAEAAIAEARAGLGGAVVYE